MNRYAIGIDLGGTNTVFGIVDNEGNILAESHISTKAYPAYEDYDRYISDLCDAMHALVDGFGEKFCLVGIGVGAPNGNYYKGTVDSPVNLWKFSDAGRNGDRIFHMADDISSRFGGVDVRVTNDANAATIGEMIFGGAKGMRDFFMVTLGTGVGSGFVANGELIYGHDGFAGEFGHVIVDRGGRECGCGRKGCLEAYASAVGIKRTAIELMARMNVPSRLRDISYNDLDSAMLSQAADEGDQIALEAFRLTGQKLGYACADAVTITSPEAIFFFGGLAKAGEKLFRHIRYYMEENMLSCFRNKVKVLPSLLQDRNIAVLGAAALIWQKTE